MNPDFGVTIDRRREAQPFRSKSMGFYLWADIDQRCLEWMLLPYSNDVRGRKRTLKLHSRTPSLLQDSAPLHSFGLTAESGMNGTVFGAPDSRWYKESD